MARVEKLPVAVFHLENLIQHVLDDLDGAMPRTPDLVLRQVGTTLSPPTEETGVSTTLVFARLVDFIEYMDDDPYDLLFARNVRVSQGNTTVNKAIAETFVKHPDQFAYSSNGITLLCERAVLDSGLQELRIANPRVVNGSQTLHSVREAHVSESAGTPTHHKRARVMVRIIAIPPFFGSDAPKKAAETKEVINRISIRSNQQNPIKGWNLRANDEFQMELSRRFRTENLFYERRDKEWRTRSAQLKSVGISRGPSIKSLMEQAACYHWDNPELGPWFAKGNLGELFQGEGYEEIRKHTSPELAYQVYLVSENVNYCLHGLWQKKYRIARRHIDLVVLSLVVRALDRSGAAWNKVTLSDALKQQAIEWDLWAPRWDSMMRSAADRVLDAYAIAARHADRRDDELTLKNFVRRKDDVKRLVSGRLPSELIRNAASVVSAK